MLLLFRLTAPPHVADEGRDEDHGSEGEGEDQGSLSSPGDGGDEDSNKEGPIKGFLLLLGWFPFKLNGKRWPTQRDKRGVGGPC